jgi:hypothetical protein
MIDMGTTIVDIAQISHCPSTAVPASATSGSYRALHAYSRGANFAALSAGYGRIHAPISTRDQLLTLAMACTDP